MEAMLPKPPPVGVFSQCMKGERIRYQQTGEFHFLTFGCFRRRAYLSTGAAMELFEDALETGAPGPAFGTWDATNQDRRFPLTTDQ
jgi:hypothetical protein